MRSQSLVSRELILRYPVQSVAWPFVNCRQFRFTSLQVYFITLSAQYSVICGNKYIYIHYSRLCVGGYKPKSRKKKPKKNNVTNGNARYFDNEWLSILTDMSGTLTA